MTAPGARPAEDRAWQARQDAEAAVAAQCAAGNSAHESAVLAHHSGPGEAAAVAAGVTARGVI